MEHRPSHIAIIISAFVLLVVTAIINFISWTGISPDSWFNSRIYLVYEKSYLEILPAQWTFQIWTFIYMFQFLWGAYSLSLLCRKTNDGLGYLYYSPAFMPMGLYLTYMINLLLDIGWIFTFDREMFQFASPIMLGISITLYICLGLSYYCLNKHGVALLRMGHRREIVLVRMFVQNGLAMYGTWVTVTSVINIGVVLTYSLDVPQRDSSTICLGILVAEVLAYGFFDMLVIDRSSRYTVTPYITLVYAMAGILARVSTVGGRNLILAGVVFTMVVITFVFKIVILVWRNRTEPEPILRSKPPSETTARMQGGNIHIGY